MEGQGKGLPPFPSPRRQGGPQAIPRLAGRFVSLEAGASAFLCLPSRFPLGSRCVLPLGSCLLFLSLSFRSFSLRGGTSLLSLSPRHGGCVPSFSPNHLLSALFLPSPLGLLGISAYLCSRNYI